VIPDYAECFINLRSTDLAEMENKFVNIAQKIKVHVERMTYRPPKPLTLETEKALQMLKASSKKIGIPVTWKESGGVCDGNLLAASGCIAIDSLGVRGKNIHTEEEWIYLPSLIEKAKETAFFLHEIATGNVSIPRRKVHEHHGKKLDQK